MHSATVPQQSAIPESSPRSSMSPIRFFQTMHAYQQTAALRAAIELDLFSVIDDTLPTVAEIAHRTNASERGIRALCNYLVVLGFLQKSGERYSLTPDSAFFLRKKSPAYLGGAVRFMAHPAVTRAFDDLSDIVRSGGPLHSKHLADDNPAWVDFAQTMAPIARLVAELVEQIVRTDKPIRVLDVASSHGLYGIFVAQGNPQASIVALDFPAVLNVTKENTKRFLVADRYSFLPGDALSVSFDAASSSGYDLVLVPNLLHHWDRATIGAFLSKVHRSLAPGGRIAIVEFATNDDRVSPPIPASFVMNMFANTLGGDAYSFNEYKEMLRHAGFAAVEEHPLSPTPQTLILAAR